MSLKERQPEDEVTCTVINPRLNSFIKKAAKVRSLTELAHFTLGDIEISPITSSHLRIQAPTEQRLKEFLSEFKKSETD